MRLSGMTYVRNAIKGSYLPVEVISQMLPICDEIILSVDTSSEDDTVELAYRLAKRNSKIKVFETHWNLRLGPEVISVEANKTIEQCSGEWILAPQCDEVLTDAVIKEIDETIDDSPYDAYLLDRTQMGVNFQQMWQHPNSIVRLGRKDMFFSAGDGLCMHVPSNNVGRFTTPGVHIFDVTRVFCGQFDGRAASQQGIWWHVPDENRGAFYDITAREWADVIAGYDRAGYPEICTRTESPFDLPECLKYWVGKPKYHTREELL